MSNEKKHNSATDECGCDGGDCGGMDRRTFVKLGGATLAALGASGVAMAGPFAPEDTVDHFVPADKKLNQQWVKSLFEKGEPTWYRGDDLNTIGMPVGGICAGQVYLTGDGRLVYWGIFNQQLNSGYGSVNYKEGRLPTDMVVRTSRDTVQRRTWGRALPSRSLPSWE